MATLVLGAVGRAVAGPVGGILGAIAGGQIDRAVLGGRRRRPEVPAVQSAAHGEPIPWLFGRIRVAGNLIWSSGIVERAGSGKRGSSVRYTASLALGLSARAIAGIGRVWADGRQLRDADGRWAFPVTMRLHRGSEQQPVDPLMAAAEGAGGCPAYLGLAYVVFEELALAEFGNRIPAFAFEVLADDTPDLPLERVAEGLAGGLVQVGAGLGVANGYAAATPGSLADALAPLLEMTGAALAADGQALRLRGPAGGPDRPAIEGSDALTSDRPDQPGTAGRRLARVLAEAVEIGHLDPDRDYQPGLQRAARAEGLAAETVQVPAAMTATAARALAARLLARREAERLTRTVVLPWRHLDIGVGEVLRIGDDPCLWRVRERRFERFLLALDLVRAESSAPGAAAAGDGGRVVRTIAEPAGPTMLHVLDLPGLEGIADADPGLLVVGAGSGGWRGAPIELSRDGGASYQAVGVLSGLTAMGLALSALPPAPAGLIDRWHRLEVRLLSDAMWLEALDDRALLAGGNLALLGDELVQFGTVEALGDRVFRLGRLLRGRRGTEAAIVGHAAGERFVLLAGGRGLRVPVPLERLGAVMRLRATGAGDIDAAPLDVVANGRNLLPLSPVGLAAGRTGGDVWLRWRRRSRSGYAWADFIDAPLGEAAEAYRVRVWAGAHLARELTVSVPELLYTEAMRAADGAAGPLLFEVAQMSALVGPGSPARLLFED